ncbi:aldehyde reductase [Aspergillus sclerotialis]|uniref:D-xylose reductase [NAD(P)H] n=1 Tax=Aspergillus sclerotialis TaxID=2070753 RepID=A0A3A2ZLG5_9EURO|nr:aldehyde reductase [Aspergillus sclerotialis]
MSLGRVFKLNSGYEIPAIGFGTWLSKPNEVGNAVEHALHTGYRHIDAAALYANEQGVGSGWRKSGVPRNQIFITSKLWNTHHHPAHVEEALDKSLSDLQTDYLDLYLIHWPVSFEYTTSLYPIDPTTKRIKLADVSIGETWAAMEKLVTTGKVRSIGVSNFTIEKVEELLRTAKIMPAVNQYEGHPYLQQPKLLKFLKDKGILPVSYSPRGNDFYEPPRLVHDPTVVEVAKRLGKDPFALLLSWGVQRGTGVLAKSVNPAHIETNFQDFIIPDEEFETLNKLDRHHRYNYPSMGGVDVFGEQGQNVVERRAEETAAENRRQ